MSKRVLHFTLGPVQGFIAQARRTRDLWAGSFLLSWLTGCAMQAVAEQDNCQITLPDVQNDLLYRAISEKNHQNGPRIGSLPNRFIAVINNDDFKAKACEDAVRDKWEDLSSLVWKTFIKDVAEEKGHRTKEIWDSQISSFWDMAWVIGEETNESMSWLDRRKNWRTHFPPAETEGGDHCRLMGDWREISGYARARNKTEQDEFWAAVRNKIAAIEGNKDGNTLQLEEDERLCAIALVKRLFPVLFKVKKAEISKITGFVPEGIRRETDTIRNWRSTAHIAATPWVSEIVKLETLKSSVNKYISNLKEEAEFRPFLFSECKGSIMSAGEHELETVDGRCFYKDALLCKKESNERKKTAMNIAAKHLSDFRKELENPDKNNPLPAFIKDGPSPFFAVLVADGDRMGDLLQKNGKETTAALGTFTEKASAANFAKDGLTIYAGGDDYLGLFPVTDIFAVARNLRQDFDAAFKKEEIDATLSAAILIVPYDEPLSAAIGEAHTLLDKVAKDRNGRNSVAVCLKKGGAVNALWVTKWGKNAENLEALENLAKEMAANDDSSSSYLYKLHHNYRDILADMKNDPDRVKKFLLAERMIGSDGDNSILEEKEERFVSSLIGVCCTHGESSCFSLDGALIARFLGRNGFKKAEEA
jgi:CRISPR-associated protein Cmr2